MRSGSLKYLSPVLALLLGCGTAAPPDRTTLSDSAVRSWFDNSLHLDLENELLWGRQDEETLLRQLGHADVVAVGSIQSIGLASHYGAERHMSLAFRPEEILHGSLDAELDRDRQLVVRIAASTEAFEMARQVPRWNNDLRFLLLLRRSRGDVRGGRGSTTARRSGATQGTRGLRWAIYLPPSQVLAQVRTLFSRLAGTGSPL